jgi:hypothetical protein
MPLHHTLACDPSRRFRRCAPLLLVVGFTAVALAPGLIAGDRPFQTSLCGDLEQAAEACAQVGRAVSAPAYEGAAHATEPAPKVP